VIIRYADELAPAIVSGVPILNRDKINYSSISANYC